MKFLYILIAICGLSSLSAVADVSGWTRLEAYFQTNAKLKKPTWYSSYHFVAKPSFHVTDSISLNSRLDLKALGSKPNHSHSAYKQNGWKFADSSWDITTEASWDDLYLSLTEIYASYNSEFFNIRLGRSALHLGLGTQYSDLELPFYHWVSLHNYLALYLEYSQFRVQPILFADQAILHLAWTSPSASLQAEAFYQKTWNTKPDLVEAVLGYATDFFTIKAAVDYLVKDDLHGIFALESSFDLNIFNFYITLPKIKIKAGANKGDLSFHPNYSNYSLLTGQPDDSLYVSSMLSFSFFQQSLTLNKILVVTESLETQKRNFELDLEGIYQLNKNMYFYIIAGALVSKKDIPLSVLGQLTLNF